MMPTKDKPKTSGTSRVVRSSKRAVEAIVTARQGEVVEARSAVATELRHRALERWENEGGSGFEIAPAR
jgi:hypothetical protein